jgi:hypothetical protein
MEVTWNGGKENYRECRDAYVDMSSSTVCRDPYDVTGYNNSKTDTVRFIPQTIHELDGA